MAPAILRKTGTVRDRSARPEQIRQDRSRVAPAQFFALLVRRSIKVGVDELDRLIHAFGGEDAPGERIEKALCDLPADRLR